MTNIIEMNPDKSIYKTDINDIQSRSEVKIAKRRDNGFPIILIKGRGYMHMHANGFLLSRYHHPSSIDEKLNQATLQTIINYADHIRYWLNICALLEKSYLYADYQLLQNVLKTLREEGVEEASLSQYIKTWRLFYKYLDAVDVPHHMDLPAKIKVSRMISDAESQGDFLNYTRRYNKTTVTLDPLIDSRRIIKYSSFISQVLSKEQMRALISELRKTDVIYGVMAKVQFDTLLRINELITYFPHTGNDLTPDFKCWGEMHLNRQQTQKLYFIGKGRAKRSIDIDIRTIQLIEDNYLTSKRPSSDIPLYNERKHKFLTKYLKSKDGHKSSFTHNSDVLWLTEEGRPVSIGMYQEAFRNASRSLTASGIIPAHIHVRPHAMRYTGATLRLVNYKKETGVDIHVDNDGDIHAFLQDLLGHSDMKTTHRYIRTVRDKTFSNLARKTIIKNEELWVDELSVNNAMKKGVDAIKGADSEAHIS
jgi:site-specific recombinase XerD